MANASTGSSGGTGKVWGIIGSKYNPYTDSWEDVYGWKDTGKAPTPPKTGGGGGGGSKPPGTGSSNNSGSDGRGSSEDTTEDVKEQIREITYDLEATASLMPDKDLKSREIVRLSGLGTNFSGDYFVNSITHTWNRSGYKQEVSLLRSNFVWKVSNPPPAPKPPVTGVAPKPLPPKKVVSKTYTVKKNDTLWSIAKKYYGSGAKWTKLWDVNKTMLIARDKRNSTDKGHWIYPGQVLKIPN
jgi:nucleoid-associated protein YgaU